MINRNLDFVVVGVQKSATTWLYDCLNVMPGISLRDNKNEDYYFQSKSHKERGDEWYWGQFNSTSGKDSDMVGCVSVDYIRDRQSLQALKVLNPEIKVIVNLRNPVDRTVSAVNWYYRKRIVKENTPEGILQNAIKSVVENISTEYEDIISRSKYYEDVKYLFELFGKNVLVISYDGIAKDSVSAFHKVCGFLGMTNYKVPKETAMRPKRNSGNKFLLWFQRRFPESRIVAKISDVSNQILAQDKESEEVVRLKALIDRSIFTNDITSLITLLDTKGFKEESKIIRSWL